MPFFTTVQDDLRDDPDGYLARVGRGHDEDVYQTPERSGERRTFEAPCPLEVRTRRRVYN